MSEWEGEFGDRYTERNQNFPNRSVFWAAMMKKIQPESVLEVGANIGFNVAALSAVVPELWATDVNKKALGLLRAKFNGVNAVYGDIRRLPFRDGLFELVFTCGVLIHVHPDLVDGCIQELTRVSRRYILLIEYEAEKLRAVPYRGIELWKAPFGEIASRNEGLRQCDSGQLWALHGFDAVTWWLYEKRSHRSSATREHKTARQGPSGHRREADASARARTRAERKTRR